MKTGTKLKRMHVIHFTRGAADPLTAFDSRSVRFLPLADGHGDTHVSCAHLEPGAKIEAPPLTHAATLLVIHGRVTITKLVATTNIDIHAGMGCIFDRGEPYSLHSDTGAILLIVESLELTAHPRGISSPGRIARQRWPSDAVST